MGGGSGRTESRPDAKDQALWNQRQDPDYPSTVVKTEAMQHECPPWAGEGDQQDGPEREQTSWLGTVWRPMLCLSLNQRLERQGSP